MVVVATLTGISVATYRGHMEKAEVSRAEGDITEIEAKIALYQSVNGRLPSSLSEVNEDGLLDPWGHPYYYHELTGQQSIATARKDRNLVPLNSDYDLFSAGPDNQWRPPITAPVSQDDIIRANNGAYVGSASDY